MTTTSYPIDKSLFLISQTVATKRETRVEVPTNHLVVVDCSGSMSSDLPKIREQLKKKLPKLLKDGDTFSMIWFSGRGDFGTLIECEPVATLGDLNDINKQIDRWLRPVGLTGFKEPLVEAKKLIEKISKKNKNTFSLFFMSDGCDNQWDRSEIIKAVEQLHGSLSATTFVEYGYYADRPLLAAMAAKCGGSLIFAESFDKYEPIFNARMQCRPVGGKRIEVKIEGDPIGGFVFALDGKEREITTYEVTSGKALVGEHVSDIWYLSPSDAGGTLGPPVTFSGRTSPTVTGSAMYAALSLFAVRGMPEVIYPLLKATGDVTFINAFANCFGKQAYSDFMERAKTATFEPAMRFVEGYDPDRVPPEDAFTVMDLLNTLQADDQARILMDHPSFQYSRVSRGRVDADENLSSAEQEKMEAIQDKMKGEKNAKKLKELQAEIDAILATKKDALKFVADAAPDGYEINGLVFNETRPNVSFRVRKTGVVNLSGRIQPSPNYGANTIPVEFKTYIFRNYTIVKDGLVNIEKLPVLMSAATLAYLEKAGVKVERFNGACMQGGRGNDRSCYIIDVKPLPIINRKMVKSVTAKELIELEYELLKTQAAQKVYNHIVKEKWPDAKLAGWAKDYGDAAAEWLKEQGLTEYSGFNPKMVQAPVKDFYMGKELEVKLKGMSKLPSVNEVLKTVADGKKLNACSEMMQKHMVDAETFLGGKTKDDPNAKKWAIGKKDVYTAETRALLYKTAQLKTSILVGQVWPKDLGSMDNTTMTVKVDGKDIVGTLAMREIQIEI